MRFVYTSGQLVEQKELGFFEGVGDFFSGVGEKGAEIALTPIVNGIKVTAGAIWNWFINVLPDLMGYAALGFAVAIILGAMSGKNNMMRYLLMYGGIATVAICILGSV